MVRTYLKKSTRGSWSADSMKQAIDAVLSKTAGYRKASQLYNVPQTTLERHVAKIKKGELSLDATPGNFKPVFSKEEEVELVKYIKEMEKRLFGLTTLVLRKLAYQLAEKSGKAHNFNNQKNMAGVDGLKGFMKRHPDLSIRKPEATSAARAALTSTPYKNELEERDQLKRTKKSSNPNDPRLKKNKKQKTPKTRSDVDKDELCLYCVDVNHTYLKSSEHWVACQLCGRWAHTACAGVDDEDMEEYHTCLYCEAK